MRDKTVCIIDDEFAVRQSLKSLVRSMGGQAREYQSAEVFLARDPDTPFHCVVCDIQMTPISGLQLLAFLRARGCGVPFIFVTGQFSARYRAEAQRYGALCVLEKPFDPEELAQWIERALTGC